MKIAVFRALQLGDLLLAVPALRALRAGFPGAEITLIGLPWARAFVHRYAHYLDRFVEFPGYPGIKEAEADPVRTGQFLQEQRAYGYSLAIQMHGSGQASNPFTLALGAPRTAGYYVDEPPPGLTVGAPYPADRPEVLRNLELALLLGCPDRRTELEFPLLEEDHAEAAALLDTLQDGPPLVGIHPGARSPARRWPARRFAAVADHLSRKYGARILLTGGPGEEETAHEVTSSMEGISLNLSGCTSLGGLAAVISRLDLFISNDTGPAHIADAVRTPSVVIFGPADPLRWAPLDRELHTVVRHPVECSPCPHWECPIDHRCLLRIDAKTVIAAAERLISTRRVPCSA